jgi:hypothetical protein
LGGRLPLAYEIVELSDGQMAVFDWLTAKDLKKAEEFAQNLKQNLQAQ